MFNGGLVALLSFPSLFYGCTPVLFPGTGVESPAYSVVLGNVPDVPVFKNWAVSLPVTFLPSQWGLCPYSPDDFCGCSKMNKVLKIILIYYSVFATTHIITIFHYYV